MQISAFPWIFHPRHRWWFMGSIAGGGLWFWDTSLDWLWTSPEQYPFAWSLPSNAWLFYALESSDPRWFFNLQSGEWMSLP